MKGFSAYNAKNARYVYFSLAVFSLSPSTGLSISNDPSLFLQNISTSTLAPQTSGFYPQGSQFPFSVFNIASMQDLKNYQNNYSISLAGPTITAEKGITIEHSITYLNLDYIATVPLPRYISNSNWSPYQRAQLISMLTDEQIYNNACIAIQTFENNPYWDDTITEWHIVPDKLRHWIYEDKRYLELVTSAINDCDKQGRLKWMLESRTRSFDDLIATARYQDWIKQEIAPAVPLLCEERSLEIKSALSTLANAAAASDKPFAPVFMIENDLLAYSPHLSAQDLQQQYNRSLYHDLFLALALGAKGIHISAAMPYPSSYHYQMSSYLDVSNALNGPLNLGQWFLFGDTSSTFSISAGATIQESVALQEVIDMKEFTSLELTLDQGRTLLLINSAEESKDILVSNLPSDYQTKILWGADDYANIKFTGSSWSFSMPSLSVLFIQVSPVGASSLNTKSVLNGKIVHQTQTKWFAKKTDETRNNKQNSIEELQPITGYTPQDQWIIDPVGIKPIAEEPILAVPHIVMIFQ